MIAATFEYSDGGRLIATLANGEVWRYVPADHRRLTGRWLGHTADDYAPVSAEFFADYIASVAAGIDRGPRSARETGQRA